MAIGGLGILTVLEYIYVEVDESIKARPKSLVILIISISLSTFTLLHGASLLDTYISSHQSECEPCMWALQP